MSLSCQRINLYFFLLSLHPHGDAFAQPAHPHPQDSFPFFLFLIMKIIITAIIAARISNTTIVPGFTI